MPFYEFKFKNDSYEKILRKGKYFVECWGASGGGVEIGGFGSYVSGYLTLKDPLKVFIYVGEHGKLGSKIKTFNGGGASPAQEIDNFYGYSGGGATDIRLKEGAWNDFDSLKSRIIVAAGGGGSSFYNPTGKEKEGMGGNGGIYEGKEGSYSLCLTNDCSNDLFLRYFI